MEIRLYEIKKIVKGGAESMSFSFMELRAKCGAWT